MSLTRLDLVHRALSRLAPEAGQIPADEDTSTVDGYVDGLLSRLSAAEVLSGVNEDEIPEELFNTLAGLLVNECGHEFGQPGNEQNRILLENQIRVMVRGKPTREPLAVDYF